MDIVFVTLFCIAVGTAIVWCGGRCTMPDGHYRNILLFWRRSTAALGLPGWRLFRGFTLLSPFLPTPRLEEAECKDFNFKKTSRKVYPAGLVARSV